MMQVTEHDSSKQAQYTYAPEENIKTHELAQLLPILASAWKTLGLTEYEIAQGKIPSGVNSRIEGLPQELRRHFQPPAP